MKIKSQHHRKFAIFSSILISKEKFLKSFCFFSSYVYSKVIYAFQLKTEEPLKNKFSLKIRPKLKIANFLITILQIFL